MKTQSTECNPSVTMTVTCVEAMTLWHALERLDRTHRKTPRKPGAPDDGKWGHYDCPPDIQPLLSVIKGSIHAEHPELFETLFGYKPEDYKPTVNNAPLPQAPNDQALPHGGAERTPDSKCKVN